MTDTDYMRYALELAKRGRQSESVSWSSHCKEW